MMRVKKNDKVHVLAGRDRGKEGAVIQVLPSDNKVLVQGVGVVTRHVKPRKQGDVAAIRKEECFISLAKVMPVCPSCNKPCRVQVKKLEDNKSARICNRCKEVF